MYCKLSKMRGAFARHTKSPEKPIAQSMISLVFSFLAHEWTNCCFLNVYISILNKKSAIKKAHSRRTFKFPRQNQETFNRYIITRPCNAIKQKLICNFPFVSNSSYNPCNQEYHLTVYFLRNIMAFNWWNHWTLIRKCTAVYHCTINNHWNYKNFVNVYIFAKLFF